MSESEKEHWDHRYASGDYRARTWPSPFLEAWLPLLPSGRALDVACGTGRNALRLAEAGYRVDAVDISDVAISAARALARERQLDVNWIVADLDGWQPPQIYDLITIIRYVNRDLWPVLVGALARDGWLLVEHHFRTRAVVDGPTDPEFRLRPQELLDAFGELRIVYFAEGLEVDKDGGHYALQRLVACHGDPGW